MKLLEILFHQHDWKEIARTYAEPQSIEVERISPARAERFAFGVTTILWECKICQGLREEELLGKEK